MICRNPNCSMENAEDLVFCKYCGRRLRELKNNSKRPMQIMIGLAAVIVLFLIGRAFFGGADKVAAPNANKIKVNQPINNNVSNYKYAFIRNKGNGKEIFISNFDGTVFQVTNSGKENKYPNFSPDGKKIAFERIEDNKSFVYVIGADGKDEKKLTEGHAPTWSSDGAKIIFYNKDTESISNFIYSIKLDGAELIKETKTQDSYYMSRYSEDGQKIAITKRTSSGCGIYSLRMDFKPGKTLFETSKRVDQPSWTADSNKLAYVLEESKENNDIYAVDLNGNNIKLVATQANEYSPSWTSDNKVLFTRDEIGGPSVYKIDADGKNETLLIKDAAFASISKN